MAAIRRAWLEHGVIFFRDQELPPAAFLAFARRFGEPIEYPFVKGLPEHPEIIPVLKLAEERINFGGIWHSDTAYLDLPPMASMLIAREVPPAGGDTLFANMYLAYEALSDGMKRLLEGLRGVNSSASADVSKTREDRMKDSARADARQEYVATPSHRAHASRDGPQGALRQRRAHRGHRGAERARRARRSSTISSAIRSGPSSPAASAGGPRSIAFWDNRCVQHNAVNDYQGHRRLMHRITLARRQAALTAGAPPVRREPERRPGRLACACKPQCDANARRNHIEAGVAHLLLSLSPCARRAQRAAAND